MKRVDILIVAGFTGAGKTTYINSVISDGTEAKKTVVILNDFGEASLKNGVLCEEWRSGCPCCEGQRFFVRDLQNVYYKYLPVFF